MGKIFRRWRAAAAGFPRAKNGNVAMMFGLSLIPLAIAAGTGLDFARAMMVRSAMEDALDAAALAVGSTPNVTQAQATALAGQYFTANYKGDASFGTPGAVSATINGQSVNLSVTDNLPTTLLAVAGYTAVPVTVSSTVVWGQTKLWVALVLDNTGSMTQTDSTGTSKLSALKTASHNLLTTLQGAAATSGDVQVSLVPFSKDVNIGTGNAGANWIDWSDWASQPPGVTTSSSTSSSATINGSDGPGSDCPFTTSSNRQKSPFGFYCTASATNGDSTVSSIPDSGLICPGVDSGNYNDGRMGRYYNGCYNSVPTKTLTTTKTASTPTTVKQSCSQTGSGAATCSQTSSSTGNTTNNTSTATTSGYSGDSGPTTTNSSSSSTSDGTQSCSGSGSRKKCTWTRTIVTTAVATTVTASGAAPYSHAWVVNDHSSWTGCLMDRTSPYNQQNTAPGSGKYFPAENAQSCVASQIIPLPSSWSDAQWTTLSNAIDNMSANGATNQTIGLAHGWQTLTGGDPYNAPTLPANTSQYIILLSDGLNTQDRWDGDGSNQSSAVDTRMATACTNAKAAGIIIYAVFVDLGGTQGNSTVLQNCASDKTTKYFDLTTSGAIITTFNQIAQQITNVRVSQ